MDASTIVECTHWIRAVGAAHPVEGQASTTKKIAAVARPDYLITSNSRILSRLDDDFLGQHGPEIVAGYGEYTPTCNNPAFLAQPRHEDIKTLMTPTDSESSMYE